MSNILIVDDEKNICVSLTEALKSDEYSITTCGKMSEAEDTLSGRNFDLGILDIFLPDGNGLELFRRIKSQYPDMQVIIISGAATIKQAVEAVRLGAYEILEKPLSIHQIRTAVRNALRLKELQSTDNDLWAEMDERYRMIGESPALQEIKDKIATVAPTSSRVLISGESGTGKELCAYAIHRLGSRSKSPFVRFNMAAIPRELFESELFGHEKGSFTGAVAKKIGRFEQAHKGTIFLDEIADMDMNLQAKILRVLQENEFERIGSGKTIKVDVRVISATNKNITKLVEDGKFREDLYYRLNVYPIRIAPLHERQADIPALTDHFTERFCKENNIAVPKWDAPAIERFKSYPFPGNIRELKNITERILLDNYGAASIGKGEVATVLDKMPRIGERQADIFSHTKDLSDAKHELERLYIETQLKKHGWNITATAKSLGMEQPNLSKKIKQLNIKRNNFSA